MWEAKVERKDFLAAIPPGALGVPHGLVAGTAADLPAGLGTAQFPGMDQIQATEESHADNRLAHVLAPVPEELRPRPTDKT